MSDRVEFTERVVYTIPGSKRKVEVDLATEPGDVRVNFIDTKGKIIPLQPDTIRMRNHVTGKVTEYTWEPKKSDWSIVEIKSNDQS